MPIIQKLPDLLVNRIAAGEVIERPASVVKELLENALDAGAGRIVLTIEDGGRKRIRVVDDGCGIASEQLELAVTPHATSKLRSEADLYNIHTLGFRGEALASIGAVAHLRIVSRTPDALEGAEIRVVGERVESRRAAGCAPGTSVEIRDLFFNVPARRKFLRGANTEFGHIQEQLARLALPNHAVDFEFHSGQRTVKQLRRCAHPLERIAAFYGEDLAHQLIPVERDERGLRITGYLGQPSMSRATGQGQYVFLNGRFIRDRLVGHAIKEAYRGLLEHARHPVVFLMLGIDPAEVDVNVHPTKIEVRWQDANRVYTQVLSALRETLLRSDLTPALRPPPPAASPQAQQQERQRIADFFKSLPPPGTGEPAAGGLTFRPSVPGPGRLEQALEFQSGPTPAAAPPPAPPAAPPAIQLHRTYLVAESPEGLLIIDQHALHERIIYDQLKQRLTDGALESQRLLIPETVELTPQQIAVLERSHPLLAQLGIELSRYGSTTMAIQSFPSILSAVAASGFLSDLVDRLSEGGNHPNTEVLIHSLLDMMACKAAVKAGDPLTPQEVQSLIAQRTAVEKSSNCPHGRPTTLRFTLADLERQFKRS